MEEDKSNEDQMVNQDDVVDETLVEIVDLLQNNGYGIAFVIPAKESWN